MEALSLTKTAGISSATLQENEKALGRKDPMCTVVTSMSLQLNDINNKLSSRILFENPSSEEDILWRGYKGHL